MDQQQLQALKEKRANLIVLSRGAVDVAYADGQRDLNTEEQATYDAHWREINSLQAQIDREVQLQAAEASVEGSEGTLAGQQDSDPEGRSADPAPGAPAAATATIPAVPAREDHREFPMAEVEERALRRYLRSGTVGMAVEEQRALQADSDEAGGYIVAPMQFVRRLIRAVDDAVFIRGLATVMPVGSAASLGVPSLDADPADADWTTEILTGSEDTAMDFSRRELTPHPLAKLLKVSNKLIRIAVINVEDLVMDRLAYKFGVTQEKAFLTGSGTQQPLGVMTATVNGISTGRDVSTGNTTTAIGFDGLKEAKYSIKGQYWPRLRWIFHRDAVKNIAKLKDGDGQYIWADSVRVGEPDRLLNFPVHMSEFQSNTFTSGLYVGILGDFSNYWIADSLAMQVVRLNELYAATDQVGFIGRLETDGMPVLEEAFARVKLA